MSRYRDDESYAYLKLGGRVPHPDRQGGPTLRADPAATARRRKALKASMDDHRDRQTTGPATLRADPAATAHTDAGGTPIYRRTCDPMAL